MQCKTLTNCRIRFQKSYTPSLFYVAPPVIYYESFAEIWFDSKSTQNLIQDISIDEMKFINMEIDGSKLDFETSVTSETDFSSW